MATQTTYYNFNKPEGTDLVNPLVDTNPNWDALDADLHDFNERSIANCTEVTSLGVHAISRLDQTAKFLKWIATANFTAGDTFTVDGLVVAASTPAGGSLSTNAYVTGAVVLACLNSDNSAMTVYVAGTNVADDSNRLGGELPAYYATDSDMNTAQNDITNLQNTIGNTSIVGIGDGTATGAISALNNDLTVNNLLSYVDLSSYNSFSNRYTFQSNGYLEIYAGGGGNVSCRIFGANATADTDTHLTLKEGTNETSKVISVKKGMSVYQYALTQSSWIRFYPLS